MEKDNKLLPLQTSHDLQPANHDYPSNYSPMNDDDSFEDKRSVREYFNIVYKRLPIIVALTILTTAVVAFYMYKQPSEYQASTAMIIEPRKAAPTSKEININFANDTNYYATQLLLLKSPDLMREVVIRLNLHSDPNLFGAQNKGVLATFRSILSSDKNSQTKEASLPVLTEIDDNTASIEQVALTPEEKKRVDSYAGILIGGLDVAQVERTNLVNISVKSTNPELAAKVSNKVAEVFIEQDIARATQGAEKNLLSLSKSIEELKGTTDLLTRQLIVEQNNANLPLTGAQGQEFNAGRLQAISTQLLAAKDKKRSLEANYAALVDANNKGEVTSLLGENQSIQLRLAQIAVQKAKLDDRIQKLNAEIQDLTAKKAQLLVRYTDEYRDVVAINEEIKKRQEILQKTEAENSRVTEKEESKVKTDVAREVLTGARAQLASAQKQEAQLQAAFDAELSSANRAGVAETRLTTLTREIETSRQLLDTLTQRQKEQELTVASSKPDNLKIMSSSQGASLVGPNRGRNIFIAFLLSLVSGIGLAFLLDYLDDSIKSSDDVGRYLGLPTLALIPYQSPTEKRKLSLGSGNGNSTGSVALSALEDNRSAVAEAYRHLRTSLLFSSAGRPPHTILVTSSQPAEGKTTTAINTAIALAQSGAEVVIVDCDLRRPRLHNHFNLENSTGLTNYLSGDRNTENLLKPFANLPQLKIITSGPIPPNPTELLSSNEMKNLLQFLKGNFKHVIIDSPPAISFTDAAILSTLVDGVVLVAMAGKSSVHLMRRFKQRLGNIGARIYGVVLNGIKANSTEYGYYGYGYTYNYYAPDNGDDSTPLMEDVVSAHEIKK
jgi:capsular exopolysaccharide synthesis family protein